MPPARGVVKRYNPRTQYGFIVPEQGGADVYVHADVCVTMDGEEPTLRTGQVVEYQCDEPTKGADDAQQ
eukprot:SAG31_NODE_334_length_17513_cov_10.799989_6_plen_69_part_00